MIVVYALAVYGALSALRDGLRALLGWFFDGVSLA